MYLERCSCRRIWKETLGKNSIDNSKILRPSDSKNRRLLSWGIDSKQWLNLLIYIINLFKWLNRRTDLVLQIFRIQMMKHTNLRAQIDKIINHSHKKINNKNRLKASIIKIQIQ